MKSLSPLFLVVKLRVNGITIKPSLMILLLFVPNRTSKTHVSMNTGIAALVASSGKVKPKVS